LDRGEERSIRQNPMAHPSRQPQLTSPAECPILPGFKSGRATDRLMNLESGQDAMTEPNPTGDWGDDSNVIPLHGIAVSPHETPEPVADSTDDDRPTLAFREHDVPGRDYQPRLLRFGEAA
jgi:hypothetical protein